MRAQTRTHHDIGMLTFEPHGWQVGRRSSRPNDFRAKEKQNGKTADTPLTHPSWSHRLTAGWLASRPACLPSDLAIYESAKQIPHAARRPNQPTAVTAR